MIDLTPDARRSFDEYLQRMRATLRGTRAVAAEEVEQDVVEHVELALAGSPAPIDRERLRTVLEQLGPPERWLPEEERTWWRKVMDRVMTGPDDWRLAYASFALTLLMMLFLPVGGILLVVPAFLLSRAYVELMKERGETLGARKWLVLPPIVIVMVLVSVAALIGAAAPVVAIALENDGLRAAGFRPDSRYERMLMDAGFIAMVTGAWWIVLSGIFAMLMRPFRALFQPVTAGLRRGHALVLTIAGAIIGGLGAFLLFGV